MGSASVAYARARENITRICRGDVDARALRLEVLAAASRVPAPRSWWPPIPGRSELR